MRIAYNKLSLEVVQVVEDDNSITAFPANVAVIQGDTDTVALLASVIGLDVSQIPNINMSAEYITVLKDRNFGQKVLNEFLSENRSLTLTTDQSIQLITSFATIKSLLEVGAIRPAYDVLSAVSVDGIFTQARKDYYVQMMADYLGI